MGVIDAPICEISDVFTSHEEIIQLAWHHGKIISGWFVPILALGQTISCGTILRILDPLCGNKMGKPPFEESQQLRLRVQQPAKVIAVSKLVNNPLRVAKSARAITFLLVPTSP